MIRPSLLPLPPLSEPNKLSFSVVLLIEMRIKGNCEGSGSGVELEGFREGVGLGYS